MSSRVLSIGIDGLWTAMDFARLLHLVVRFYRLEHLILLPETGGPNIFDDRLDPVVLKHLAAFDWIAAPLMSAKFNDSYARSEEFVRNYGVDDLRVHSIDYGSPGHIAFSGIDRVIDRIARSFGEVLEIHQPGSAVANDAQGRISALEAVYAVNMKEKANLMKDMQYSDAELHAIVSPSIEDLHFISNAITQGRIVTVEKRAVAR